MRRLTIEEAEKRQTDLVKSQTWKGAAAKYWFVCEKHGKYFQEYNSHNNGNGCPDCAGNFRLTIQEAEKRHSDLVKGQIWKGVAEKYRFVCKEHGKYSQIYNDHNRGHGCPDCGGYVRLTTKKMEKEHSDMVRGQTCKGARAKYWFVCGKHGEYFQEYNNHDQGQGCPICSESKGEKEVARVLGSFGLFFSREKSFFTCRNSFPLRFDFYIPGFQMLVERHGRQHYQPVDFAGRGKKWADQQLKDTQHRDDIKKRWAKSNGYKLVIISHRVKNIEQYFSKRCSELSQVVAQAA